MAFSNIAIGTVALSAIAASSVNVQLPKKCSAVLIANASANPVAFRFGVDNTVAALFPVAAGAAGDMVIPSGQTKEISVSAQAAIWVAAIAGVAGPSLVYISCGEASL